MPEMSCHDAPHEVQTIFIHVSVTHKYDIMALTCTCMLSLFVKARLEIRLYSIRKFDIYQAGKVVGAYNYSGLKCR